MYLNEVPRGEAPRRQAPPRPPAASSGTVFHPGLNHNHQPTGRWADVQRDSGSRCQVLQRRAAANPLGIPGLADQLAVECACANLSPQNVARVVRNTLMQLLPLGQRHLDHYLAGSGADLTVDLADVIRRDRKVRAKLAANIRRAPAGHFKVNQSDYDVKDFQFAFGAIDRLDYAVDRAAGTVHVWFKDRYEWHPVGFGYRKFPDDGRRSSNCVHAAMVELKSSGANDYWMVGDALVPLRVVTGSATSPSAPRRVPRERESLEYERLGPRVRSSGDAL